MLAEILELFAFGVAVHDTEGPLVFANRAARAHLQDPLIARTIRAARPGRGAVAGSDHLQVCSIATESLVVTFISNGETPGIDAAALLCELTATEQRVARFLIDGSTARQIATRLDVSLHTVQSHFKSLFAKTHTKSQNELIARLRGPLAFLAIKEFFAATPAIKGCANNSAYLTSARVHKNNRGESP